MENKLYQVSINMNLKIHEVEYEKITDSFYVRKGSKYKDAINTNHRKSFKNKEDAIIYLESLLNKQILHLESSLEYYKNEMVKFKETYKLNTNGK